MNIMLRDRTKKILEASIREFIKSGEPVTSARLYRNYNFGIKPAMIRWELHDLSNKDFFYQNHPSGGRVPSDKAYQFFVEELVEEERIPRRLQELAAHLFEGEYRNFIKHMARTLGVLGIYSDPEKDIALSSGFEDLIAETHQDRKMLLQIAKDFEMIPERVQEERSWWEEEKVWPQVFIGRSPLTKTKNLSVIIGKVQDKENDILLMALGPKRMDYENSLRLFRHLRDHMYG